MFEYRPVRTEYLISICMYIVVSFSWVSSSRSDRLVGHGKSNLANSTASPIHR
jgi:hypothetical protein